jgi:transposase-like protein
MAKPAAPFVLTPSDHATLQGWSRMGSLAQRLGQRAKILLLLAEGFTPKDVSQQLQISAPVVFKWRKRYLEAGLEGLNDLPRSGQPRKLSTQKNKGDSYPDNPARAS